MPYSTMTVPGLRDARPAGWVTYHLLQYMSKYNAESPKQGSKRFNSIVKTINIADLGIIYLCLDPYARNWGALELWPIRGTWIFISAVDL